MELRILAWGALTWLAFTATVLVALMSGVKVQEEVWSWIQTGIPTWLQGIGTVVTAGIAWAAYLRWRRPDDARRRADTAQEIIRTSQKFESALIAARAPVLVWDLQNPKAPATNEDLLELLKSAAGQKRR